MKLIKQAPRTCAHCQGQDNQGSIVEYEKLGEDGQVITEPTHVWCVALCRLEGERHQLVGVNGPEMALVQ